MSLATTATTGETLIAYLPLIGAVSVAIIAGLVAVWNRRRGAQETKAPSVSEIWAENRQLHGELEGERRWRRFFEDLMHTLGRALISMTARHPAHADEQRAVDKYRQHLESKETP